MNWRNVKLILVREVRDQLRDRRTLFMIFVLPLLLYPLLGTSLFQVAQFLREQPTRVLVVNLPEIEGLPPLVEKHGFAPDLVASKPERARLLKVDVCPPTAAETQPEEKSSQPDQAGETNPAEKPDAAAELIKTLTPPATTTPCPVGDAEVRRLLDEGRYDVAIVFPGDFAERLAAYREGLEKSLAAGQTTPSADAEQPETPAVPGPTLMHNSARESSQIAYLRTESVVDQWRDEIGEQNLRQSHLPITAAKPFEVDNLDVADESQRKLAMWSKILPFVLLLWALTGAFYPAVDLCAGEKERGTLETLLSSPAERSEIVWGKLLTVMLFSIATAVLNLLSMGITGTLVVKHMAEVGPPPLLAIVWLLIALVPVSALFSGLCLALAALARSTKEGQYYLMPLVLVTMPLTILPMSPGVELNLGNSLIPVTGIMLLLRTLLEGNYALAALYAPPVAAVTLVCCLLAVRWAADQFNTENVLFRESERLDMGRWLRSLRRDRDDTPSVAEALACGVLILLIHFFMSLSLPPMHGLRDLVKVALVVQLVVILTPAMLMTIMLTRSPRKTLLLRLPAATTALAVLVLAVAIHPLAMLLQSIVTKVYPVNQQVAEQLSQLLSGDISTGTLVLVIAVVPAICEELAFRGFVLSGLRHLGHRWRAIVLTSIFFGVTHPVFQQSLVASILGLVLGFIAVQSGSIFACMLFHMVHNSLAILLPREMPAWLADHPGLSWLATSAEGGQIEFTRWALVLSTVISIAVLVLLGRRSYAKTKEESLQEAIEHQTAQSAA